MACTGTTTLPLNLHRSALLQLQVRAAGVRQVCHLSCLGAAPDGLSDAQKVLLVLGQVWQRSHLLLCAILHVQRVASRARLPE